MLTWIAAALVLPLIGVLGLAWLTYFALERDASAATEKVAQGALGLITGAVGMMAVLGDQLALHGGELIALLFQVPGVILALLGIGQSAGMYDLSPGMFAIAAIGTFVISAAIHRG